MWEQTKQNNPGKRISGYQKNSGMLQEMGTPSQHSWFLFDFQDDFSLGCQLPENDMET